MRNNQNKDSTWIRRGAIANIVYTAATLIILAITFWQAHISQNTYESSNRAWIAPVRMSLSLPLEENSIKYQLHVENTGHQPVIKAVYGFHTFTVPYVTENPDAEQNFPENIACSELDIKSSPSLILYPGTTDSFWLIWHWNGKESEKGVISKLLNRSESLIVDGCILYETMGDIHFRYFLRDVPGPSFSSHTGGNGENKISPSWTFNVANTGNDAN